MKTAKFLSFVLILLSLSIVGVSALSTPVATTLAVEMTSDPTVHNAAKILENTANVYVVKYGSLEYALLIHRTVSPVFWISHGNDQGLQVQNHMESWSFAKDLVLHLAKTLFSHVVLPIY